MVRKRAVVRRSGGAAGPRNCIFHDREGFCMAQHVKVFAIMKNRGFQAVGGNRAGVG
jgi:hypothetical protein